AAGPHSEGAGDARCRRSSGGADRSAADAALSAARRPWLHVRHRRARAGTVRHRHHETGGDGMSTARMPPGRLALGYLPGAAVALPWLATELTGHYYHPRVLALTHTVTLGWITLTIMGASYQLVPVLLERPVWSERLAWWQLGMATVGTAGLVGHFVIGEWR